MTDPETKNSSDGYRKAYDTSRMKPTTVNRKAKELMDNGNIQARIKELRDRAAEGVVMGRREALERLTLLARTGVASLADFKNVQIAEDRETGEPIYQATWQFKNSALQDVDKLEAIQELVAGRDGVKIKTHSQIQAIQQLAKMQGWEAPTKTDLTNSDGSLTPPTRIIIEAANPDA